MVALVTGVLTCALPTSPEQFLTSSQAMAERFADVPSALANTLQIARRCNLTLNLGTPRLPEFPTPDGITLDDYMIELAEKGRETRMEHLVPDERWEERREGKRRVRMGGQRGREN